jgi:hypothetical protein
MSNILLIGRTGSIGRLAHPPSLLRAPYRDNSHRVC